ncbi:hypothetical protein [Aequorivita capsosiphonis]|uniref:hypothetical protein n=1 Tax=Aequorivita capsosiphonis TaxID=487317 RepID=UPI00047B369C|nr:hypothetical protein [Aequorivita capsosiphonis]
MRFFLKCNEAAHVCDKSQYNEAGFWDIVILKMHLAICKLCRNYSKQNVKLTDIIAASKLKTLHPEEKQRLKMQLQQEMNTTPKP